jgi:hypothetical protein
MGGSIAQTVPPKSGKGAVATSANSCFASCGNFTFCRIVNGDKMKLRENMIPDWNISAVLPPIRPGATGQSFDRSPYKASFSEVVDRFAKTTARLEILRGLLKYRIELRKRGVEFGFQWLDGSFMENKEHLLSEAPKDIDVVTFFHLPNGMDEATFSSRVIDLFDAANTKSQYHVDAYPCVLGGAMGEEKVTLVSYWYSMWSHRRNGLWKGFVQVDISAEEDDIALALIEQIGQELAK